MRFGGGSRLTSVTCAAPTVCFCMTSRGRHLVMVPTFRPVTALSEPTSFGYIVVLLRQFLDLSWKCAHPQPFHLSYSHSFPLCRPKVWELTLTLTFYIYRVVWSWTLLNIPTILAIGDWDRRIVSSWLPWATSDGTLASQSNKYVIVILYLLYKIPPGSSLCLTSLMLL